MTVLCCARNSSSTAQLRPGVVSSGVAEVKETANPSPAKCPRPSRADAAALTPPFPPTTPSFPPPYAAIPDTLRRHSRHPHIAIPAKAGIHTPTYANPKATGVLDSGLRRNDGGAARPIPRPGIPGFWIPASAGMTVGRPGLRATGVLDSGRRRNDGGAGRPTPTPRIPGFWVPASAGMTVGRPASGRGRKPPTALSQRERVG